MSDNNPAHRKRKRLFGRSTIPGSVFLLDTSRRELPLNLLRLQKYCQKGSRRVETTTTAHNGLTSTETAIPQNTAATTPAPATRRMQGAGTLLVFPSDTDRREEHSYFPHVDKRSINGLAVNNETPCLRTSNPPSPFNPPLQPKVATPAPPDALDPNHSRSWNSRSSPTARGNDDLLLQIGAESLTESSPPFPKTAPAAQVSQASSAVTAGAPAAAIWDFPRMALIGDERKQGTGIARCNEQTNIGAAAQRDRSPMGKEKPILSPVDEVAASFTIATAKEREHNVGVDRCASTLSHKQENGIAAKTAQPAQGMPGVSASASKVASFLKQGSTSAVGLSTTPSRSIEQKIEFSSALSPWSGSPPTTPTYLVKIVTGVPPKSGRCSCDKWRRERTPNGIGPGSSLPIEGAAQGGVQRAAAVETVQSPSRVGRGSRFCNDEWSLRLKERRRIVRFPKRSEPAGTRILYWVRGNYRVRDNLALSVAMWLSTKLKMPLQAVVFVDPAIRKSFSSHASSGDQDRALDARQQLPFRMAVEASALCEMEEALRGLNVPLVAVACIESEVPAALSRWCDADRDSNSESADSSTSTVVDTKASTKATAHAATPMLPRKGGVHVAITDESYHPRQLLLVERAKETLRGVALYTVDSSCVCPVNTYRSGQASVSASTGANESSSRKKFRQTQDDLLPTVCAELIPRMRLPLEAQLQKSLFGPSGAVLPRGFEGANEATPASAMVLEWDYLRQLSSNRFNGFGKPISARVPHSTEDLIAIFGGGERVGEAALQQTIDTATEADRPASAETDHDNVDINGASQVNCCARFENELTGTGFEGSLLHLLRLGSISSLRVVQTLFDRVQSVDAGRSKGKNKSKSRYLKQVLGKVLDREYALYRSFSYFQRQGRHQAVVAFPSASNNNAAVVPAVSFAKKASCRVWRAADWMGIMPVRVWKELQNMRWGVIERHQHSPQEVRLAGSTAPSTVQDAFFSAIQGRLMIEGRLHSKLAPYWVWAVLKMVLIPSQAIALLIDLAEDLCLGGSHSGDIVPEIIGDAFDAFRDAPANIEAAPSPAAGMTTAAAASALVDNHVTGAEDNIPVFRRLSDMPLASLRNSQSAFGGAEKLARFLLPLVSSRGATRHCSDQ